MTEKTQKYWLELNRKVQHGALGTAGRLSIHNGEVPNELLKDVKKWAEYGTPPAHEWATLENPWIDANKDGISDRSVSRIPSGVFRLDRDLAGRFVDAYRARWGHDFVPMIADGEVPGRSQILFHTGNRIEHTHGCILIGDQSPDNTFEIINSRHSYLDFFQKFSQFSPEYIIINDDWTDIDDDPA